MKGGVFECEFYGDHPPLVLAATGGSAETLSIVGRYGDGLLTNLPGMSLGGPEKLASDIAIVRRAAEEAGRDPNELRFAASVLTLMADDETELNRLAASDIVRWNTIVYGRRVARVRMAASPGRRLGLRKNLVPERL